MGGELAHQIDGFDLHPGNPGGHDLLGNGFADLAALLGNHLAAGRIDEILTRLLTNHGVGGKGFLEFLFGDGDPLGLIKITKQLLAGVAQGL